MLDADVDRVDASDATGWRLHRHVAALGLLLIVLMPLLGRGGLFSADEGAAMAQARLLNEEGGWALPHPVPAVDPEGQTFPLENASAVDGPEGEPASAPFAKHPAYVILLVPFDGLGGAVGMVLTSVLGTIAAAAVAGLLMRRFAPDLAGLAVWATGLATPLFVDSWLVIAHTIGAALVACAVLAVLRAHGRDGSAPILTAGLATAAAVLMRNEALLFGVVLALSAGWLGWRTRRRPTVLAAVAVLVGTIGGYVLDGILSAAVSGDAESGFSAGAGHAGFLAGRVMGAIVTLVLPSYGALGLPDALLVLTAAALVGAVVVARRRPDDTDGVRLFALLAAGAAVGRVVLAPEVAPGLFVAAPAVAAGLASLGSSTLRPPEVRFLAMTAGLFAGAVLATQYASGGSGEWGGRYFALALPVVVPVLLLGLRDVLGGLAVPARRALVGSLVVTTAAITIMGGASVLSTRERTDRLVDTIATVADGVADPVIVATAGAAPRFAWTQVLEGEDWMLVPPEDLSVWLERLGEADRTVVLATPDLARDQAATAPWRVVSDVAVGRGSPWTVLVLDDR